MNRFTCSAALIFSLALSPLYAAVPLSERLLIEALPDSEGTLVDQGQPAYQKRFQLSVSNVTDTPLTLNGRTGCYKAFDQHGKEFDQRSAHANLYGTLAPGNIKEGKIWFASTDRAVYDATFVKWSQDCPSNTPPLKSH